MGVVVLNPQDCLRQPFSHKGLISPPPHMKQPRNPSPSPSPSPSPNPNPNRSNRAQPNRRPRRTPHRSYDAAAAPRSGTMAMVQKSPANKLDMSHVKILKRGEELKKPTSDPPSPVASGKKNGGGDVDLASPVRSAPDLEPNRVGGFYAGSSMCIVSPPPSSLPLPAFFRKKSVVSTNVEATNVLLSVLRLDL